MKKKKAASLKLIVESGSQKGKEFTFDNGDEIILGRSRYANVLIDEKQASRRHARIYAKDGYLFIEDLDSINGTFVNGKGIETARLATQDSVEIGRLRIHAVPARPNFSSESPATQSPVNDETSATLFFRLSGPISENSVFDVIEHLAETGETGTLIVRVGWGTGRIFIKAGHLLAAAIDTHPELTPRKVVQRMLRASSGSIQFNPKDTLDCDQELGGEIETIRNEDKHHAEEFMRLIKLMPAFDARLIAAEPANDVALSTAEGDLLRLIVMEGSLTPVMDKFKGSDTEALKTVADLIEKGIVTF